jgi:hypothetical protein
LNSSSSSFGGVAVLVVVVVAIEVAVIPRGRDKVEWTGTGGGVSLTGGSWLFFEPKEKVRPARFRKPELGGLGTGGRLASDDKGFLAILASSAACE